ncbi:MAG TPA: hypothetical protein VGA71_11320, partial [Actinomycetota bacterium]
MYRTTAAAGRSWLAHAGAWLIQPTSGWGPPMAALPDGTTSSRGAAVGSAWAAAASPVGPPGTSAGGDPTGAGTVTPWIRFANGKAAAGKEAANGSGGLAAVGPPAEAGAATAGAETASAGGAGAGGAAACGESVGAGGLGGTGAGAGTDDEAAGAEA